jgi:hypothetical protein
MAAVGGLGILAASIHSKISSELCQNEFQYSCLHSLPTPELRVTCSMKDISTQIMLSLEYALATENQVGYLIAEELCFVSAAAAALCCHVSKVVSA